MKRVLIIEDDPSILRGLSDTLRLEHYQVESESDGVKGLSRVRKESWDILILDVMLPGMNGWDICKVLRQEGNPLPILMLTGRGEESERILGLELGADDYVTKPFSVREVTARVRALLRRQSRDTAPLQELRIGPLHIDFRKQVVSGSKRRISMTAREFALLRYLAEREGEVVSRDEILRDLWGYETLPTTRTVDNYVLSIRKKIEPDPGSPRYLLTVPTVGYKFQR